MENRSGAGRLVVVTGATGRQGGSTARHLLARGFRVRAVTRDPSKPGARALAEQGAEVVRGDLDGPTSLEPLLRGADGVFSVQNFWETGYEREIRQGIALADLAKAAGTRHLVYSSVASAHRKTGLAHFESKWLIEEHLRASGLPHTVLRPVWFMENWAGFRDAIQGGTLPLPLSPDRPFQQIATDDVGAFAALVFERRDDWLGRAIDLASDERSVSEVAGTFGRVIGRPVRYERLPWDQYERAAGEEYTKMFRWFEAMGYDADLAELRRVAPQLTSLEQFLEAHQWTPAGIA